MSDEEVASFGTSDHQSHATQCEDVKFESEPGCFSEKHTLASFLFALLHTDPATA